MDTTLSVTPQFLLTLCAGTPAPLIIDVRREAVFQSAPDLIAGAVRHHPAAVADWAATLPAAQQIVVYCVHGHEVSQNAAKTLRERGLQAQFLEGGLEAWRAAGGAIATRSTQKKS